MKEAVELAHTFAEEKLKASRKEAEAAIEEANKLQTAKKEKVHKDCYLYYFKSSSVADSVQIKDWIRIQLGKPDPGSPV